MTKSSGGLITYNYREGSRSEYLANYVFSAFGPSILISKENDYGLDIICNLAEREGVMSYVKSSYGVQVKSEGFPFKYTNKQATEWLFSLEFPLILAEVSKSNSYIKIYSSWNLNKYLLLFKNREDKESFPNEIVFRPSNDDELGEPDSKTGDIPIGKPILEFNIMDIGETGNRLKYGKILKEWLDFENENYRLRLVGIPCCFGYIKWETNKSLEEKQRIWQKRYFFSPHHSKEAKQIFTKTAMALGVYYKASFESNAFGSFKIEFNDLREYVLKRCKEELSNLGEWETKIFKNEI